MLLIVFILNISITYRKGKIKRDLSSSLHERENKEKEFREDSGNEEIERWKEEEWKE